jgi:superfamily I DNA/RNA helicase
VRLSGLEEPVYSGYRRVGGAIQNYDIFFYSSDAEQRHQLLQWLKDFEQRGYRRSEITILSFGAADQSIAAKLAAEGRARLRPVWQHAVDAIGYASVHAFKGLENKTIILTDVVLGAAEFHRNLFYTGMTRACESVRILCDRGSQQTLTKWITERKGNDRAIETH